MTTFHELLLALLLLLIAVAVAAGSSNHDTDTDPFQRHLVGTGDPSEMVISWATNRSCPGSTVVLAHHQSHGKPDCSTNSSAFNAVVPWTCTKLPAPPANESTNSTIRLVHLYDTKLTGLLPGQQYSYQVGSDGCGWSDVATFSTADPRRFVVLADFGHQREAPVTHAALRSLVERQHIDAIIHAGDFAYDLEGEYYHGDVLGDGRRGFVGLAGDRFMEQIGTYAKSVQVANTTRA